MTQVTVFVLKPGKVFVFLFFVFFFLFWIPRTHMVEGEETQKSVTPSSDPVSSCCRAPYPPTAEDQTQGFPTELNPQPELHFFWLRNFDRICNRGFMKC